MRIRVAVTRSFVCLKDIWRTMEKFLNIIARISEPESDVYNKIYTPLGIRLLGICQSEYVNFGLR